MKKPITEKKRCKKCKQIIDPKKKNSWGHNILLSIDQFGNAVANGNPDSTISARAGYYANYGISETKHPRYWKFIEKMIDFAWWPIERKNHCKEAYDADPEIPYPGNWLAKIVLLILALVFSLFVSTLSYIAWLIFPTIRKRYKCEACSQMVKPGPSNLNLKNETNEKSIEEIEDAFQYLTDQIDKHIEIIDRITTVEGNYDSHFATTSIVKFELMNFVNRTSGGIGMIEGKDGQTFEFRADCISEISGNEEEIIINLAIKEVLFRRIEIEFNSIA